MSTTNTEWPQAPKVMDIRFGAPAEWSDKRRAVVVKWLREMADEVETGVFNYDKPCICGFFDCRKEA